MREHGLTLYQQVLNKDNTGQRGGWGGCNLKGILLPNNQYLGNLGELIILVRALVKLITC